MGLDYDGFWKVRNEENMRGVAMDALSSSNMNLSSLIHQDQDGRCHGEETSVDSPR